MSTLYVDQRGSRLSFSGGALEVRLPDARVQRVPVAQLGRVVVVCEADLAAGLLRQLAAAKVPLVVLRGRARADAAVLWPHAGDARRRLLQRRVADDPALSLRLARLLVRLRIRSEQALLQELRPQYPRARYAISRALRMLRRIRAGLAGQGSIDSVRGAEGAAARIYFAAWCAFLPASLRFSGRRRRPPTDPVNSALSLGYSLLHARALEVCHAAALDAGVAVLHAPEHNRPSLACDLVEPERIAIEAWVRAQFVEGRLAPGDFERSQAGCLLAHAARGRYFAAIESVLAAAQSRMRRRVHCLLRWMGCASTEQADG